MWRQYQTIIFSPLLPSPLWLTPLLPWLVCGTLNCIYLKSPYLLPRRKKRKPLDIYAQKFILLFKRTFLIFLIYRFLLVLCWIPFSKCYQDLVSQCAGYYISNHKHVFICCHLFYIFSWNFSVSLKIKMQNCIIIKVAV